MKHIYKPRAAAKPPKGGQTMDINIAWNEEELEAIEELNEIFNL